jgi:hypothetical protein
MKSKKLTVRVPEEMITRAKVYARSHGTSVTRLVSAYLSQLPGGPGPLAEAPTVKRLSGSLPPDLGPEDYRRHLEEKYGRADPGSV